MKSEQGRILSIEQHRTDGQRRRWTAMAAGAALFALLAGCSSTLSPGGAPGDGETSSAPSSTAPPEPEQVIGVPQAEAGAPINPTDPVVVQAKQGSIDEIHLTNADGEEVEGELAPDGSGWRSSEDLGYGKTYQLEAMADLSGQQVQREAQVTTLEPQATAYPSLVPPPSQDTVGVGQPLVVRFDQDIEDKATAEKSLTVTSEPAQPGAWHWISDSEVHYRPKELWQPGTSVTVDVGIYGKKLGAGVYGDTDRSNSFQIHDSWVAKADGATKQMRIEHNGELVKTMPISMGSKEHPTHLGRHVISAKHRRYTMDSCTYGVCKGDPDYYRLEENYSMRISNSGEFVHENPATAGVQGSQNVSHGCVNLNTANAKWFFSHFSLGDVVEVVNSGGEELPVYNTYGDWALSWEDWQEGSALG